MRKTFQDMRQELVFPHAIIARLHGAETLALDDDLRPGLALRLQKHRIHVHRWLAPRGERLGDLRPADLATLDGYAGIVRHVLRLERRDV